MSESFRAAFVTSALTAFAVQFLVALAENDAARAGATDAPRAKSTAAPIAAPVWPNPGAVRVIDLRRPAAAVETATPPAPRRTRGAA